jgi:3-oxoacyl-[acyl-carrier-protein] synthase III
VNEEGPIEQLFWTEEGEFLNFRGELDRRLVMRMNGGRVFLQGTSLMIDACRSAWQTVAHQDRRLLVASHQPSGKMLNAMINVLQDELPCLEFLNHLSHYANSISSTIPVVLAHLNRILKRQGSDPIRSGDFVLLPAAGISMSHKATHMAQGWAVLEW